MWLYDQEYSRKVKAERVQSLIQQGLHIASVTIGDPIDKPDPLFYKTMVQNAERAIGKAINPSTAITVGDSHEADVRAPLACLGFHAGYWLTPGQPSTQLDERTMSIGSLLDIPNH